MSLSEGFVTYSGFVEAFRIAEFTPDVVMKIGDIFSLMNLVSGGVGFTLLPGRVRGVFQRKVQLIPLQPRYLMRQTIGAELHAHARARPQPARAAGGAAARGAAPISPEPAAASAQAGYTPDRSARRKRRASVVN